MKRAASARERILGIAPYDVVLQCKAEEALEFCLKRDYERVWRAACVLVQRLPTDTATERKRKERSEAFASSFNIAIAWYWWESHSLLLHLQRFVALHAHSL